MGQRHKYRRKENTTVVAVKLDLVTDGFIFQKWGGPQRCRAGDWLVLNGDDTHTVAGKTFARTYRQVSAGVYERIAETWAEVAPEAGRITTEEGSTGYEAGDFLVIALDHERGHTIDFTTAPLDVLTFAADTAQTVTLDGATIEVTPITSISGLSRFNGEQVDTFIAAACYQQL